MDNLLLKIKSYNIVSVITKEPEKILNLIQQHQVAVWDASYSDSILQFKVVNTDIDKINSIIQIFSTSVVVEERLGTQRLIKYIFERKAFFISLAAVVAAILFFSSFIWKIEIFGARRLATSDILEFLYSQGVRQSTKKSSIDLKRAEVLLLKNFEDLSDAQCEIKGTILKISVVERESPIVQFDKSVPVDIIASAGGTIREFACYNGRALAKEGMKVKAGDILISGRIPYEYRNESGVQLVHAMGIALAYETITANHAIEIYVPIESAPYTSQKTYYAFGRSFSATNGEVEDGSLFIEEKNKMLSLGWIELPILYDEIKWYTMGNCRPKTDTEIYDEIYKLASEAISAKQKIRSVTYQFGAIEDQKAEVSIVIDVSTNIAIEQEIGE